MALQVAELYLYPVKSCAPWARDRVEVERRGLAGDRRWMIVADDGHFLTGRQHPRLTQLRALAREARLQLSAPGRPDIEVTVPQSGSARMPVTVWRSRVDAVRADRAAEVWISEFLGLDCRLVYMDAAARRDVDPRFAEPGDEVSFADGFPLLLTSTASLAALNAQLSRPVSMRRFRPNLVIAGGPPHAEDSWTRVRVGVVEFEVVKPCSRCVFTTVDPETGEIDPEGEPLRTLTRYRRTRDGVMFGMNLIARGTGPIRVGDPVQVLD